jgi:signal transduction histidine kinase
MIEQALDHRDGITAKRELEKIRSEFYAIITHDLRNPTSTIISAVSLLVSDDRYPLVPEQSELVDLIDNAADKLLRLISDYLDYAKIDAGYLQLNLGEVDLRKITSACVNLIKSQVHAKNQLLAVDLPSDPVVTQADAQQLQRLVDNLLSNAIKYTPAGGKIHVTLAVQDNEVVLRVSDSGIGIQPEQQAALFSKYHRVPGEATRTIHGTGLGLVIVKEIVEAHGGRVWVESEGIPGKGSTFFLTIPYQNRKSL